MDQLDSGKSLSVTDMKQELGMAVAMLDKVNTATSVRDYRFVAYKLLTRSQTSCEHLILLSDHLS